MNNILHKILIGFTLLTLVSCSSTTTKPYISPEQRIMAVVDGYENALRMYDSKKAISYLHRKLIEGVYGSEANYYKVMENAFSTIKRDGGIIKSEKWGLQIDGNKASITSRITTKLAKQEGVIKLEQSNGKWLIVKIP